MERAGFDVKNYKVTCLNCGQSSRIKIMNKQEVMYIDHTPIIACRFRPDLNWGFECQCGNDSRIAPEEKSNLEMLVQGGQHAIDKIAASLKIPENTKFKMETT